MYYVIENKGEVDPKSYYVMGLTSKESTDDTIGQFGTGNKYGIAALLRAGNEVIIKSGSTTIKPFLKDVSFRDKEHQLVCLKIGNKTVETGMTVGMGKYHWEVEHGLRELVANAIDEGGYKTFSTNKVIGDAGTTRIYVSISPETKEFFMNINKWFNFRTPLFSNNHGAVYDKTGDSLRVYRKGVLVLEQDKVDSVFDYDIFNIDMKEDRSISAWDAKWAMKYILCDLPRKLQDKLLDAISQPDTKCIEAEVDMQYDNAINWEDVIKGKLLVSTSEERLYEKKLYAHERVVLPNNWINFLSKNTLTFKGIGSVLVGATLKGWEVVEEDEFLYSIVKQAIKFLHDVGYKVPEDKVKVARNNAADAPYGQYIDGQMLINETAIKKGLDETISTLIEEYFHHVSKAPDETRLFQQYIFDELTFQLKKIHYLQNKEVQ